MSAKRFSWTFLVEKKHLDSFNHVNNAMYLTLFEEARWNILNAIGYNLHKIMTTQVGPTILEIKLAFLKELLLGDEITIESTMLSYRDKIGVMQQKMLRNNEVCCKAEFVMGLFDLKNRKLILPTNDWLAAIGWEEPSC